MSKGYRTAIYPPAEPDLPFLAVVFQLDQADATPFPTRIEAEAYLEVCEAGFAKQKPPELDA